MWRNILTQSVNISELTGAALDWAVAKCEYPELIWGETIGLSAHAQDLIVIPQFKDHKCWWRPSTNWTQGGPIIEREGITVSKTRHGFWESHLRTYDERESYQTGPTPLIAAMRCYVASKLGDTVEIPKELLNV